MTAAADPHAVQTSLLGHRSFAFYWCVRTFTNGAYMMQAVAAGWQIYALTGSAFDLGLVGLVQFFPVVVLGLLVGHVADRYDRRRVAAACQIAKALAAAAFAYGSYRGWLTRDAILALLFVSGTARAFEAPTMHAMVPGIVPRQILPRAIAASSTANQTAIIVGPAIGGFLYAFGPSTVYSICTVVFIAACVAVSLVNMQPTPPDKKPVTLETLFAGFSFIWKHPVVLGAVSLDLFAVLLGGVTALLPIYAKDILVTGPWGLGLLRSAPAIGALGMSIVLAHVQMQHRIGHILFVTVAMFGVSSIAFAFSTYLVISMIALTVYGACDAISVVIRHSLVQTNTPHEMLGRVLAVNFMFTGTSGTLGEFRAGAVAAAFGAFTSVLVGGVGAVLVALLWMRLFPEIRRIDSLGPKH